MEYEIPGMLSYGEYHALLYKLELTAHGSAYIYEVNGQLKDGKKDEYFDATLPLIIL